MKLGHVEGAILAGGASLRMGRGGATPEGRVARVAGALGACLERVRIVVRSGDPSPLDLERIDDERELRAPIVGLEAALGACEASAVLVAAGDLPEVDPRVLLALLALVPEGAGPDVVAPCGPRGPEPLLAVYRPRILPEVRARIERGELALHTLLDAVDTLAIPELDIRSLDPDLRSLRNPNRPEDLE